MLKDKAEGLTPREMQILMEIVKGKSSKEIADSLDIKLRTVENHRTSIISKLKAKNMPEAVALALRLKLID